VIGNTNNWKGTNNTNEFSDTICVIDELDAANYSRRLLPADLVLEFLYSHTWPEETLSGRHMTFSLTFFPYFPVLFFQYFFFRTIFPHYIFFAPSWFGFGVLVLYTIVLFHIYFNVCVCTVVMLPIPLLTKHSILYWGIIARFIDCPRTAHQYWYCPLNK
jgi:hypothetical protein